MTTFDLSVLRRLTQYVEVTDSSFYSIEKQSLYHDVVSLIISQRISFVLGRQIRQKLKKAHEEATTSSSDTPKFRPEIIKKLDLKALGLSNDRILKCIMTVSDLEEEGKLNLEVLKSISGIGDWTYNALLIMGHREKDMTNESNIFLKEDAWIRKRISQLLKSSKPLTIKESGSIIELSGNKDLSKLSRFLWRIKESGIDKIGLNQPLIRDDFV